MFGIIKGIVVVVGSYYVVRYIDGQMKKVPEERFKDIKDSIWGNK